MRTRRRRSVRNGMTMIEVLAASALMALTFSIIFVVIWQTIAIRDTIESSAAPYSIAPTVLRRVVDDLTNAQIDALKDNDSFRGESEDTGGGDNARLDFVTAVPSRATVEIRDMWVRAQLNETGYRLRRSDAGAGLYALYRREDLGVDDEPLEGGRYYKVCDRVKAFTVDYYEKDPGDPNTDDARGVTDWDAKKEGKLPWGARIALTLEGPPADDGEPGPDLVFQAFVAFRARHDLGDAPAAAGGGR